MAFLQKWNKADQKTALINELQEQGILLNELRQEVGIDIDDFDLICHVAFDHKISYTKRKSKQSQDRQLLRKIWTKSQNGD